MIFQATVDIRTYFNRTGPYNLGQGGGHALGEIISSFIPLAIVLAAIAMFLYLIWGGFNWLTSGGDKAKVESARDRITNAIIGLTIVASAYAIFSLVNNFFGIGITTINTQEEQCYRPFDCGPGLTCDNGICRPL